MQTHGRYAPWDLLEAEPIRRQFVEEAYTWWLEQKAASQA